MIKAQNKKSDLEYLFVCIKIGIGVLLYRGLMELIGTLLSVPFSVWSYADVANTNAINYIFQMVYSVGSFSIAAAVLAVMLNIGKRQNYQPIYKSFRAPLLVPFMMIATVAINFAAAEVNAEMITMLAPDLFSMSFGTVEYAKMSGLDMVLLFISTAIIPGVVEEIFFRGLVLTNLSPYGRGAAILGSALLFGLMHMNPQQFFYTTMMGVILGYVYVRTRSIWVCIGIHILNNGLAVVQEIFFGTMPLGEATSASAILMMSVMVMGGISIAVLLIARSVNRKKSPAEAGCFGRMAPPALGYEEHPVSRGGKIAMFFAPTNGIFTTIVFISMMGTALLFTLIGIIYGFFPADIYAIEMI